MRVRPEFSVFHGDSVTFAPNQPPEHATLLSREYLEQGLGYTLWKDAIVASETKKEAKALMKCSAPYVAKIKKNGEFVALIDRVTFLDDVVGKICALKISATKGVHPHRLE